MVSVLYVCLGNICRSPVAEATMRRLIELENLEGHLQVDSAGTANYHVGELPDHRTRQNAEKNGLNLVHRCRQLSPDDFSTFDYIVAMDQNNLADINYLSLIHFGQHQSEESCFLMRRFDAPDYAQHSVPDPYYGSKADFEEVYQIVQRCNQNFLAWLKEKHGF